MILPTKTIKPVDSLFCISSFILDEASGNELSIDELHEKMRNSYPKIISIETLILCIDYLFIVGKLEMENEVINIKI